MIPSMTDAAHCYQNAVAERVNGILKDEFDLDTVFTPLLAAQHAVAHAVRIYDTVRALEARRAHPARAVSPGCIADTAYLTSVDTFQNKTQPHGSYFLSTSQLSNDHVYHDHENDK